LTDDHATGSPSNVSTAVWMSLARIGSIRSSSTWTTAVSTQPGRRGRCRQPPACRRGPPLVRTTASFSTRRPNDPCRSWFDRTPIRSILGDLNLANRTKTVLPNEGLTQTERRETAGGSQRRRAAARDRSARSVTRPTHMAGVPAHRRAALARGMGGVDGAECCARRVAGRVRVRGPLATRWSRAAECERRHRHPAAPAWDAYVSRLLPRARLGAVLWCG
jgi:hypothetical protein